MRLPTALAALFAVVAAGCMSGDPARDEEKITSDLINGDPVVSELGHVWLSSGCSGTLLSDRWVLTARHCARGSDPTAVSANLAGGAPVSVAEFYLHPSLDIAVMRLSGSILKPNGIPWSKPLYLGSAASLAGTTVLCQGFGMNTPSDGEGTPRQALLTVSRADRNLYETVVNSRGQIQWHGDSGSPCYTFQDGNNLAITGVTYECQNAMNACRLTSVDAFRDWVEGIVGNAAVVFADPDFGGASQQLVPGGPLGDGKYDYPLKAGNDAISSMMVPPGPWALNVFRDASFRTPLGGFGNHWRQLPADTDNQISSVSVMGGVELYADVELSSWAYQLGAAGRINLPPEANDVISSLTVPSGWRVTLYDGPNQTGTAVTLTEGTYHSLGTFDNLASSVLVEEPVTVYVDANYRGASRRLPIGCQPLKYLGLPNDSISSIYVPAGMKAELFRDWGYSPNQSLVLTASNPSFPVGWNDTVSSICVTSN
jgi:trypsin